MKQLPITQPKPSHEEKIPGKQAQAPTPAPSQQYQEEDAQEIQRAQAAMYSSTRMLPTIQDPKIYSVRVRVCCID